MFASFKAGFETNLPFEIEPKTESKQKAVFLL